MKICLKPLTLLCLLMLGAWPLKAQNGSFSFDRKVNDFGAIEVGDTRAADFVLANSGTEDIFFLRADVPDDCVIKYSLKSIKPGESGIIRIQYNPERKGLFSRDIFIYLSASPDPQKLVLKGNVRYLDPRMDLNCPNFNTPDADKAIKQDFTVLALDSMSMTPIQGAMVHYRPSPSLIGKYWTNQQGECRNTVPIGLYGIEVTAKGYEPGYQELYIGANTTSTMVLLGRKPGFTPDTLIARNEPPRRDEPVITTRIPEPEPEIVEKPGELSIREYGPNNIVFLIDISSSMARPEKLPLLKESMKTLLYNLRSIDRVSIVTYASGTHVLLPSTSADKKDEIARMIDELRAGGGTKGGEGIREAYKVAGENLIEGGNNIIFLATDGDFNLDKNDNALYRKIRREAGDGIKLSVIGFGNKPKAVEKMMILSDNGSGSYIHIGTQEQAQAVLVDEIKMRSKR